MLHIVGKHRVCGVEVCFPRERHAKESAEQSKDGEDDKVLVEDG